MLARLKHKVSSEHGASLSMALMLFLVCSVVASIVVAAATASSGRLSQMKDMEKSYYSVTSAASLFWDELKRDAGQLEVKLDYRCDATLDDASHLWSPESDTWKLQIDDLELTTSSSLSNANATLFQIASYDLLFDDSGAEKSFDATRDVTGDALENAIDFDETEPMPFDVEFGEAEYQPFKVSAPTEYGTAFNDVFVTVRRNDDETFSFEFTDSDPDASTPGAYAVLYTLVAEVDVVTPKPSEYKSPLAWATKVVWTPKYMTVGEA